MFQSFDTKIPLKLRNVEPKNNQVVTKTHLCCAVQNALDISRNVAAVLVDTVFNEMEKSLLLGNKVLIVGFGTFTVKTREPRQGTNPRTGETINLPESRRVFFKQSSNIARALNGDDNYAD